MTHRVASLCAVVVLSVSAVAAPAMAQDRAIDQVSGPHAAERLALARRYMAAMQVDQMGVMIRDMITGAGAEFTKSDGGFDPQAYERALQATTSRMIERIFAETAPIYADTYTLEQLQGIVAFYESDLGQATLTGMYEAAPRVQERIAELMPSLTRDVVVELCAELKCTPDELREAKDAAQEGLLDD
ncbi:hypothetical protein MMB232_01742 [Brevundimonas subvibrioides]|uniref:DUF2059 domain-containing protein n=1 Tax=Brevundimonas subvibrioides TaxID=74313 RepID=UPI0032D58667